MYFKSNLFYYLQDPKSQKGTRKILKNKSTSSYNQFISFPTALKFEKSKNEKPRSEK